MIFVPYRATASFALAMSIGRRKTNKHRTHVKAFGGQYALEVSTDGLGTTPGTSGTSDLMSV